MGPVGPRAPIVAGRIPDDRDGAVLVLRGLKAPFPWLVVIWADGGYAGEKLAAVMPTLGQWRLQIVKRRPEAQGFEVLPKRWIVERTLGWLVRRRHLRVDYEGRPDSAEALIKIAMSHLMLNRLQPA